MADTKISEFAAAAALDGTEFYAAVQAGGNVKVTGDAVRNGKVKVYRALLSQSGTDAPVATVLENTLGGTPVWSRSSVGNYTVTLVGAFPEGKTFVLFGVDYRNSFANALVGGQASADTIDVNPLSDGGSTDLGDGYSSIEILVYP